MDLRKKKTQRAIINAFLQLRSQKPLEKITVRELSDIAEINKATFYLHYHDIYDLSETLEREVVQNCLDSIENPSDILKNTKLFVRELGTAFVVNEQLIKTLFEGSRSSSFVALLEEGLKNIIASEYPDFEMNTEDEMMITYMIYGGYYTYFKYCDYGIESVLKTMEKLSENISRLIDNGESSDENSGD